MQPVITDTKSGIIYRKWPASQPKAILLLIHGLGAHSGRWEFLADFFQKNNFSSYAIELKGFGETKDLPGHISSFNKYIKDIYALNQIICNENAGSKIFVAGESMGALIAFLAAAYKPKLFYGLICISPAFKSKLKFSIFEQLKIYLSLIYRPKTHFSLPFEAPMFTSDTEYQKVIEADPREHRCATSKLLFNIRIAQMKCGLLKNRIKIPVLFMLAGNDLLVNSKTSEIFFHTLPISNKYIFTYPNMFHALSIDLQRSKVFADMSIWIQRKLKI